MHRDLLIVDDDEDLRAAIGEIAEALAGRQWVGAASYDELVALGPRAVECGLAIIDLNLGAGSPSGVDALAWLRKNGFRGRAVFLTGHARSHPDVERAHELGDVRILAKPLGIDAMLSLIESAP
jgi:ActR/RegA family two-component response regulator